MPSAITLLELAVQGVAGLPPTARLPLRPGFNLLRGPPAARDAFSRALWAVLFPEVELPAGARAALTLLAGDGQTYRLLATAGGPLALSRLDPGAARFEPLTAEGGASRLLREGGLPERRLFEPVFLLSGLPPPPESAPSDSPARVDDRTPIGIESKYAELADELAQARIPQTAGEIQARLRAVEREDGEASDLEQLQFQLDGLQQQLFQAEDALKTFDRLAADVARLDRELTAIPEVSETAIAQVQRLPQLTAKRDEALERLIEERAALEEAGTLPASLAGLANDQLFVGLVILGAASVVGAILAAPTSPGLRWLAIGDIPTFGIAAAMAVQRLSEVRRSQGAIRKLSMLREREGRIQKAFESESREVLALMKSLGVEGVSELQDRLAARTNLDGQRREAGEQLRRAEDEDAAEGRRVLRDRLRTQVAEAEQKLSGFGGYRRDRAEIRKEQEELRQALAATGGGAGGDLRGALDDGPPKDEGAGLLRLAGELFAMSPAMVLQTVRERLAPYLGALSQRQFSGASFAPDGQLTVLPAAGAAVPFAKLVTPEKHAVLTALRLCLAERHLHGHRLFLIVDERRDGLDDVRRDLCAKLLKGLTRQGQVLWLGERPAALADHQVSLQPNATAAGTGTGV